MAQADGVGEGDGLAAGHWRSVRQALVAAAAETVKAGRGTTAAATGGPSARLLSAGVAAAVALVAAAGRRAKRLCRACDREALGAAISAGKLAGQGAAALQAERPRSDGALQFADSLTGSGRLAGDADGTAAAVQPWVRPNLAANG